MIAELADALSDAGFLSNLAFVAVGVLGALLAAKVAMNIADRRAARRGLDGSPLVGMLRYPLYGAIVAVGGLELAAGISDRLHPAWAAPVRSAQGFVILFLVFLMLYRLVTVIERAVIERNKKRDAKQWRGMQVDAGVIQGMGQAAKGVILAAAALTVMSNLGIKVEGILAFGGIGTILIGFMARETLSNYFSGLVIFVDRPFGVGDWIRIQAADIEGTVEEIGWRITRVRTFDQRPLYIPNSVISANVIENPQRMTNRRIYEYLGLRYDDIGVMEAVVNDVREMLRNSPEIDQNKTLMVNFDRYGDSSVDFFVYAMTNTTNWVKFHEVKQEVLLGIARIVSRHGAEFAFPTRTVHAASGFLPEAPDSA